MLSIKYLWFLTSNATLQKLGGQVRGIRISCANDRKKLMVTVREYRGESTNKSDHKDERAHDTQAMNDPDRCRRLQVQTLCALIAILYLRLVKSRRYHDIILRGLFLPRVYFFYRTFISTRNCIPFFFLPIRMRLLFVLSRWFGPINLKYAPCVWMCKFERALI